MKEPILEELAAAINKYDPRFKAYAPREMIEHYGGYLGFYVTFDHRKDIELHVGKLGIVPRTRATDKRRNKVFMYKDYAFVDDMVPDLINYVYENDTKYCKDPCDNYPFLKG